MHDWLTDTLADLRRYALAHGLTALAAHLDQAVMLAHLEIAQTSASRTEPPKDDQTP